MQQSGRPGIPGGLMHSAPPAKPAGFNHIRRVAGRFADRGRPADTPGRPRGSSCAAAGFEGALDGFPAL